MLICKSITDDASRVKSFITNISFVTYVSLQLYRLRNILALRVCILSLCTLANNFPDINTFDTHGELGCEWSSWLWAISSIFRRSRRWVSARIGIASKSRIHVFSIVYLLRHLEPLLLSLLQPFPIIFLAV